jgi:hypothetical protein
MRYEFLALLMMAASGATQSHGLEIADGLGYWRDVGRIPGRGAPRLEVDTTLDSVIIDAVRGLSLRGVFDSAGHYPSKIDRTVLALGVGVADPVPDDGVGHRLRRVAF